MIDRISAVLPLRISGRHYAENLNRCDLLFGTMRHFGLGPLFAEVLIVVPGNELAVIGRHAVAWSDFAIRVVAEDGFLGVFGDYTKMHQVRPWHRQQIIKLFCAKLVTTSFFLTLDPDVMALRRFGYADLIRNGRALLHPEPRAVHVDWWQASASLLDLDPALDRSGMSVTPALLARDICLVLMERLEARHDKEWHRVLLENYAINWTEYTLYYLIAESSGLLDQRHWAPGTDDPRMIAPYQVWRRSEFDTKKLVALFATPQRDFFSIVGSGAGVSAAEIAVLIAPYVPITLRPAETIAARCGDKLRELAGAAIRMVMGRLLRP
jgi:hypothetical protein